MTAATDRLITAVCALSTTPDLDAEVADAFLTYAFPHSNLADSRQLFERVGEWMDRVAAYTDNGRLYEPEADCYRADAEQLIRDFASADEALSPEATQRRQIAYLKRVLATEYGQAATSGASRVVSS